MAYEQYSIYAFTGNAEGAKNRVSSNAADAINSEDTGYPHRFDVFVNKENASIGGFAVTENHATADLDGSTLYVDHRFLVDATGGLGDITVSDGVLDISTINTSLSSIDFSTTPAGTTYDITYTATTDKVFDSHINALQNAMMQMQLKLGLQNAVDGVGTGLTTLPITTTFDPAGQASIDQIKSSILPNMVMLGHLEANIKVGSTSNTSLTSHGGDGFTVQLGNETAAGSRDDLRWYGRSLYVGSTDNHILPSDLQYSTATGDLVGFSGAVEFASQVTIGKRWGGAGVQLSNGSFMPPGFLPEDLSGFYNNALLRVNGSVFIGNGMSGIGGFTFAITSGQIFDVMGTLEADDLRVINTSTFQGPSAFRDQANASYPGYFTTNNDIELRVKPNGKPGLIDNLDPSYATVAIHAPNKLHGVVGSHLRDPLFETVYEQPWASGAKRHPIHQFHMYPMLGGFSFSGRVQFAKAASFSNKNVLICDTRLQRITEAAGANQYGSYSEGFFNPGDTHIEIDNGGGDRLSYPIYYHDRVFDDGATPAVVTGLNFYVAADDNVLVSPTVNGQPFRIFQPSNAPVKHLTVDFSTPTAPTATFGNDGNGYYGAGNQHSVELTTHAAWPGPSVSKDAAPIYKQLKPGETVTTSLLTALQRSVDKEELDAFSAWGTGDQVGVAYILASTNNADGTLHGNVQLKASPSPFGIAANNVWNAAGTSINPGQWTPVGEVVGSTTIANQGNSWSLTDVVSYRPNAFYDSCWVPLVTYRGEGMTSAAQQAIPTDLGRCLPFYGSNDHGGSDRVFAANEGDQNFFVEHNIGPVVSLDEVSLKVYVSKFGSNAAGSTYAISTNNPRFTAFRDSAAGVANLWTQYPMPYDAGNHDFFDAPIGARVAGWVKDVSAEAQIRFFDSRFARISFIDTGNVPMGNEQPQYIRVIIKRDR